MSATDGEAGPESARSASPTAGGAERVFVDERDLRQRALEGLSRIGTALRIHAWESSAPNGVNPTQRAVLLTLARSRSGMRLAVLAAKIGSTPATISDSVTALSRKGLVRKAAAMDDPRALAITLTSEGGELARVLEAWPESMLSVVDRLEAEEGPELLRALVILIRGLQEAGHIAPNRICHTCRFFEADVFDDPINPHRCAFVGAPFGDANLRIDCAEHEPADFVP